MGKVKIYLSSTFRDLNSQRHELLRQLRSTGWADLCDLTAMEGYIAEAQAPLHRCIQDVISCDLYVLIIGDEYGSIPPVEEIADCYQKNPDLENQLDRKSYTECEHTIAKIKGKEKLVFVTVRKNEDTDNLKNFIAEATDKVMSQMGIDKANIVPSILTSLLTYFRNKRMISFECEKTFLISELDRKNQFLGFKSNCLIAKTDCKMYLYSSDRYDKPDLFNQRLLQYFYSTVQADKIIKLEASEICRSDEVIELFNAAIVQITSTVFSEITDSHFAGIETNKELLVKFYEYLNSKTARKLLIFVRIGNKLESTDPIMIQSLQNFFNIFNFKTRTQNDDESYLPQIHFVVYLQGDTEGGGELVPFYNQLKTLYDAVDLKMLEPIQVGDVIELLSKAIDDDNKVDDLLSTEFKPFSFPVKMGKIYSKLRDTLNNISS